MNTVITFEEKQVTVTDMERRITEVTKKFPWLVNEENGNVNGYAYATQWKDRNAYRYSAECAVYVNRDSSGKGIGQSLMQRLEAEMKTSGFHKLIAGIALPNEASVKLTEKLGFTKCGEFKEVGYKFGKWINVGYWEKLI